MQSIIVLLFLCGCATAVYRDFANCTCHEGGDRGIFCGYHMQDCMEHAVFACDESNKPAKLFKRCQNRKCIQNGKKAKCLKDKQQYFKDISDGKEPKCEGCYFSTSVDGKKYADKTFYVQMDKVGYVKFRRHGDDWKAE